MRFIVVNIQMIISVQTAEQQELNTSYQKWFKLYSYYIKMDIFIKLKYN